MGPNNWSNLLVVITLIFVPQSYGAPPAASEEKMAPEKVVESKPVLQLQVKVSNEEYFEKVTEPLWVTNLLGPTEAPKPKTTTKRPTLSERVRDSAKNAIKNVHNAISQVPSRISGFFHTLNRGTQELLGPRNRTRTKPPSSPLLNAAAQFQNSILNPMRILTQSQQQKTSEKPTEKSQ